GHLDRPTAYVVLGHVCQALAVVHSRGVVHRDLKPENVFLARQTDGEVVKLLDFGIAKLLSGDPSNTSAFGTPQWAAPEQFSPGAPISPPTDVWAVGLLAFYVLTGKYYWMAANPTSDVPVNLGKVVAEVMGEHQRPAASARAAALGCPDDVVLGKAFDDWFAR